MKRKLQRNLRLYPWYVGLFHAYFWLPVYFLFFNSKLDLAEVLYLASIYFASVVVIEVPSGWFSDTFGRKITLITASIFLCIAYASFIFANTFEQFMVKSPEIQFSRYGYGSRSWWCCRNSRLSRSVCSIAYWWNWIIDNCCSIQRTSQTQQRRLFKFLQTNLFVFWIASK